VSRLRNAVKTLRGLDKKVMNELGREMRGTIQPFADSIANAVPSQSPLSGMNHNGVTRWGGKPKASVSFTPGRSRRGGSQLLSIRLSGGSAKNGPIGFDYAEMAGTRRSGPKAVSKVYDRGGFPGLQHRVNGQGDRMIAGLRRKKSIRGKSGYFAFDAALQKYKLLEAVGQIALRKFMIKVNVELMTRGGFITSSGGRR
jgi:hypothetical protein